MPRRLVAFALGCAVIGGPLAEEICHAVCADSSAHSSAQAPSGHHHDSSDTQARHSHHHPLAKSEPPLVNVELTPAPHGCGHLEAVVPESRDVAHPIVTAMVSTANATRNLDRPLRLSDLDSRHRPSVPIRSTSPLRI